MSQDNPPRANLSDLREEPQGPLGKVKFLVVAPNWKEAKHWAESRGLVQAEWTYIEYPGELQKLNPKIRVVRVGKFWLNPIHSNPKLWALEQGETLDKGF